LINANPNNSVLFDIFLSKALLENTAQVLANDFDQDKMDLLNCQTGNIELAGTYYYGFCAQKWWGTKVESADKKGNICYKIIE
jgi:hypothetical protein